MDGASQNALLLLLLPLIAVLGVSLNFFIRARGGRSFRMTLKGFGINLVVESQDPQGSLDGHRSTKDDK